MKVAWGVMVGDARGKTGTVCATLTRAGPVLRGIFRTCLSRTQSQLDCRAALGSLSTLWSDPTMTAKRPGWIQLGLDNGEFNVFNQEIFKTGLQWFIRANRNRAIIGESVILDAPAWAAVDDPGTLTLEHVVGPPEHLWVTANPNPAVGDAVLIYATPPISPGVYTLGHQQRKLVIINPKTNSPWDILTEYTAKFGTPATGRQVFVEVWYMSISQGRIGEKKQASDLW